MTPTDLRRIREERGLTQDEVAIGAGVNVRTISRLEKGEPVRPDTVKAVCAFYGIPYEGMVDIEIVAPEHLVAHPSTMQLLKAAESLPQIRYLVRHDYHGYARYLRNLVTKRAYGTLMVELGMFGYCLLAPIWLAGIILAGTAAVLLAKSGDIRFLTPALGISLMIMLFSFELLALVRRIKQRINHPQDRLMEGFAIADDAVWKLHIQKSSVRIERIDLEQCRWRSIDRHGDFATYKIGTPESVVWINPVPDHPGVAALIERVRRRDQVRTMPLPQLEAA